MVKRGLLNAQNKGVFPSRSCVIKYPVEIIDADKCPHMVAVEMANAIRQSVCDCMASVCDRIYEIHQENEEAPEWSDVGPKSAGAISILAHFMASTTCIAICKENDPKEFELVREWLNELEPEPAMVQAFKRLLKGTRFETVRRSRNAAKKGKAVRNARKKGTSA
jgi:hypothetical protein